MKNEGKGVFVNKGVVIFIVIALIICICIIIYQSFFKPYLQISNSEKSIITEQKSATEIYENEVSELFSEYIIQSSEQVLDYKIDDITIFENQEKQNIINLNKDLDLNNIDTLAYITYSVKPKDINSTVWAAGNGSISGQWITNKTTYVQIRDGKILNVSTGWIVDEQNQETNIDMSIDELFSEYISQSSEPVLDYRIDSIDSYTDEEKQDLINSFNDPNFKATDTFAFVTYSVKPKDINSTSWIVGNGTISGQWVTNKTACVHIRDNKILSVNTGW